MRAFDFSPFFRSTVGFDHLFDMLDELLSRFYGTFEPDLVCGRRQRWRGPVELLDER